MTRALPPQHPPTVHFAIPGDIAAATGGYAYDRHVMAELAAQGVDVRHLRLPDGFPFPSTEALAETARALAAVPAADVLLIDGLAYGALPPGLLANVRAPMIVLLHHPLGLETGLDEATARHLLATEKAALTAARHVVVTSPATAATLRDLSFAPPPPVTVALPGTERASRSLGSGEGGRLVLLSVGSVIPRKAYDVLIEALSRLQHLDWRSTIAGSLEYDAVYAAAIRQQIERAGLGDRITLAGVQDADGLRALYAAADIYALPSRYEGYGMAFAAALAHGLPILAARAGAVPDTVPPEAGILVPPDDADATTEALARLLTDGALRRQLGGAAWAHGQTLPRWEDTARIIAGVVGEVAA